MVRSLCVAVILLLTPLAPALAQPADGPRAQPRRASPEGRNAALRYWAAWSAIDKGAAEKLRDVEWEALAGKTDELPAALTEAAAAIPAWAIDALIEGSKLERCDFEVEYEKGVEAMLPHLSLARTGARALRADARVKLAAGEADAAAERVAAMYRVAGHLSRDHILISSLVAMATTALADEEAAAIIDSGQLTRSGQRTLISAIERLDQGDPFHAKMAVHGEHQITADWIKREFQGADAGRRFVERMQTDFRTDTRPLAAELSRLNGAQLAAETDRLSAYYEAALKVWDDADSVSELEAIGKNIEANYGMVAAVTAAALGKVRGSDLKARAGLRDTLAALKAAKVAK